MDPNTLPLAAGTLDGQSAFLGVIATLTPLVVALIKGFLPGMPKKYIPLAAPILGALCEVAYNYIATDPTLPVGVVTMVGASGVAVREIVDQWKKDDSFPSVGGHCGFILVPLLAGALTLPAGCGAIKGSGGEDVPWTLPKRCYVAGQSYMAVKPAVSLVYHDPRVKQDIKDYLKAANDGVVAAYDACVTAATAGNAAGVETEVAKMSVGTDVLRNETRTIVVPPLVETLPDATTLDVDGEL